MQHVIESCNKSLNDWRNHINQYDRCGCREKWTNIKTNVNEENAIDYKQFINKTVGHREIHIINCGHVWYGVK